MDVVTGAFSYSGAWIAAELLSRGRAVRTLTNHPPRDRSRLPAEISEVEVAPLDLRNPAGLRRALKGVDTLYNTYWVRFPRGELTFETAVDSSAALFAAARDADVRRVVHVSITHADPQSRFGYFRGKGLVERCLQECGLSHAVVRPAILFGGHGVLINNLAWILRRFPVVPYGGDGSYRVRAIHVRDLATLMADLGEDDGNVTVDAVGPESLAFREMLRHIRTAVGSRSLLAPVPAATFPPLTWALGRLVRDVVLTRDEYQALAAGLADSSAPSTGSTSLTDWIDRHAAQLGVHYANEIDRHYRPGPPLVSGGRPNHLEDG